MELINIFVFCLILLSPGCSAARITSMLVPQWVQNGTESEVILDCDYEVDLERDKNFTLKWYFGDKNSLIYEWIPGYDFRYVSGRLEGRFNWDFLLNISSRTYHPLKKYRAVAIRRPTTEMSGRYICQVVSSLGDDSEESTMIVFAPPKNIAFSSRPLQDEERLLLAYKVEKVFPLPQVAIYQSCPETRIESSIKKILIHESGCCNKGGAHTGHSSRHNNMDDTHFKDYSHSLASSPHEESFFTLQHVQYIDFSDVYLNYNKLNCEFREGEDVSISFTLQIKIPGTDFVVTRSILFYPGRPTYKGGHHERLVQENHVGSSASSLSSSLSSSFSSWSFRFGSLHGYFFCIIFLFYSVLILPTTIIPLFLLP